MDLNPDLEALKSVFNQDAVLAFIHRVEHVSLADLQPVDTDNLYFFVASFANSASGQGVFRRWIGILVLKLLQKLPQRALALEKAPRHITRAIGSVLTSNAGEDAKLIAAAIIRFHVRSNGSADIFWSSHTHAALWKEFLEIEGPGWLGQLYVYLDKFAHMTELQESDSEPVFAVSTIVDDKNVGPVGGNILVVHDPAIMTIAATKGIEELSFIDIQPTSIQNVKIKMASYLDKSPSTKHLPVVLIDLNPPRISLNGKEEEVEKVEIVFQQMADAKMSLNFIKGYVCHAEPTEDNLDHKHDFKTDEIPTQEVHRLNTVVQKELGCGTPSAPPKAADRAFQENAAAKSVPQMKTSSKMRPETTRQSKRQLQIQPDYQQGTANNLGQNGPTRKMRETADSKPTNNNHTNALSKLSAEKQEIESAQPNASTSDAVSVNRKYPSKTRAYHSTSETPQKMTVRIEHEVKEAEDQADLLKDTIPPLKRPITPGSATLDTSLIDDSSVKKARVISFGPGGPRNQGKSPLDSKGLQVRGAKSEHTCCTSNEIVMTGSDNAFVEEHTGSSRESQNHPAPTGSQLSHRVSQYGSPFPKTQPLTVEPRALHTKGGCDQGEQQIVEKAQAAREFDELLEPSVPPSIPQNEEWNEVDQRLVDDGKEANTAEHLVSDRIVASNRASEPDGARQACPQSSSSSPSSSNSSNSLERSRSSTSGSKIPNVSPSQPSVGSARWDEALAPHKASMLEILGHVNRTLLSRVADSERAADAILQNFDIGGHKVIEELATFHKKQGHQANFGLDGMRRTASKATLLAEKQLGRKREEVRKGMARIDKGDDLHEIKGSVEGREEGSGWNVFRSINGMMERFCPGSGQ
ncbi:MAG: hypothetical protein M1831_000772 [Alyxoria varia]|nr:MAG: hypothetical protein M1831_000772 [Alyxoria varia]